MVQTVPLPRGAQTCGHAQPETPKDYFVERDGLVFAGSHLLVDLRGAKNLDDAAVIEDTLRQSAEECGATVLHVHLHKFGANGGVSGVAVLAESHITIHTWPERGYAAVDVFMCGNCQTHRAIGVVRRLLQPESIQLSEHRRGIVE